MTTSLREPREIVATGFTDQAAELFQLRCGLVRIIREPAHLFRIDIVEFDHAVFARARVRPKREGSGPFDIYACHQTIRHACNFSLASPTL